MTATVDLLINLLAPTPGATGPADRSAGTDPITPGGEPGVFAAMLWCLLPHSQTPQAPGAAESGGGARPGSGAEAIAPVAGTSAPAPAAQLTVPAISGEAEMPPSGQPTSLALVAPGAGGAQRVSPAQATTAPAGDSTPAAVPPAAIAGEPPIAPHTAQPGAHRVRAAAPAAKPTPAERAPAATPITPAAVEPNEIIPRTAVMAVSADVPGSAPGPAPSAQPDPGAPLAARSATASAQVSSEPTDPVAALFSAPTIASGPTVPWPERRAIAQLARPVSEQTVVPALAMAAEPAGATSAHQMALAPAAVAGRAPVRIAVVEAPRPVVQTVEIRRAAVPPPVSVAVPAAPALDPDRATAMPAARPAPPDEIASPADRAAVIPLPAGAGVPVRTTGPLTQRAAGPDQEFVAPGVRAPSAESAPGGTPVAAQLPVADRLAPSRQSPGGPAGLEVGVTVRDAPPPFAAIRDLSRALVASREGTQTASAGIGRQGPLEAMADVAQAAPVSSGLTAALSHRLSAGDPAAPAPRIEVVRFPGLDPARLIETGGQRLRLRIEPPELGACDLELVLRADGLHATVTAERADTALAMRDAEPLIRQALAQRGLELSGFQVGGGSSQSTGHGFAQAEGSALPPGAARSSEDQSDTPTRQVTRRHQGRVDLVA